MSPANAAPVFELVIPQHSDYRRAVRLRTQSSGAYLDLTGYTIELQVRDADDALLLNLTTVDPTTEVVHGTITIDGTRAYIVIPDEETAELEPFEAGARYDLRFTNASGHVERVLEGPAVLSPGVTQ